jgi:hypothetical protein
VYGSSTYWTHAFTLRLIPDTQQVAIPSFLSSIAEQLLFIGKSKSMIYDVKEVTIFV